MALAAMVTAVAAFLLSTLACGSPYPKSKVIGGVQEPHPIEVYFSKKKERERGIPPESAWNTLGIWKKVASSPDIYIPEGYSGKMPFNDSDGTWFPDERDGKKLFVPNEPVGDFSPEVLRGEAKKITSWFYD